ncbi:NADP-dependent oxidoreductase [Pseudarcicella hirudinis]
MNQQLKLASRPKGTPQPSDFLLESNPVPVLKDGEVLVKTIYISIDPAMRGWMNEGKSYVRPVEIGEVFRAVTAGKVIESQHPDFQEGQYVTGIWGVQEYAAVKGKELLKVDAKSLPLHTYIATLGMTGLTAYFGLLDSGQPKAGETVLVSGAAGAVGSTVGQIAKIKGCKVIGIAGGEDKCNYCVHELGFDACINYQTEDVRKALKAIAPEGIDIYF